MTTTDRSPRTDWNTALSHLQCPQCSSVHLEKNSDNAIECAGCHHALPIRDEILMTMDDLSGNNKIAANFYDGPLWKKYRFWKRFTPFNERGVHRWRTEVLQHLPDLAGTNLLDIAIGAGLNLPYMAETCNVYGVDISIEQLRDCQ